MRLPLLPALCSLLVCSPLFGQEEKPPPLPDQGEGYEEIERFIRVLEAVRKNHPEAAKLSYERLINHALDGMLESLDPFSAFYHPETYQFLQDGEREPVLPGLGLTLSKDDVGLKIAAIRPGSPAASSEISLGDRLLSIGEVAASKLSLSKALAQLSGRAGETVKLTLQRHSDRQSYEVSLLRAVVKQRALSEQHLLDKNPTVGYLHLREFSASAHHELVAALDHLEEKGMKSLILDLRGNPGGLLEASVKILGEFVPPSTEVVFTKGRNPEHSSPPLKTPDRKRKPRDYPMVVLIDRHSASASELVSGALQDLKRAMILGETSYGKGSVQHIIPQGGGTALRLTIATYHTPSGRTPHEVGITPDLAVAIEDSDRQNLQQWRRRDSLPAEQQKVLKQWQDPVLEAALNQLKKQR